MPSIIEGYNYDIFISYRQKDNKHDGWVTDFVNNLKGELESTFKEEINVYFDINPHDGLLETHDVDESLKDKLKCLIFIPIISRTYCDPKSFAWEHEFKEFIKQASQDKFGLKVKLPNGNVASRVLPVRIHDLDTGDIKECEAVLGSVLRGIEFIYKEPGVNKPLTIDDDEKKNLNNTKYRIQINKVANSIKEIITAIGKYIKQEEELSKEIIIPGLIPEKNRKSYIIVGAITALILVILGFIFILILLKPKEQLERTIAVLPFRNNSPDSTNQYFIDGTMEAILDNLCKISDLTVISRTSVEQFRNTTKSIREIAKRLNVNYILEGSGQKMEDNIRLNVQLIDAVKDKHIWSSHYEGEADNIFGLESMIAETIASELKAIILPEEKQLIDKKPTTNLTAYNFYIRGEAELNKYWSDNNNREALKNAEALYYKALEYDPNFASAYIALAYIYWGRYYWKEYFTENFMDSVLTLTNKALSIDHQLSDAYNIRGNYYSEKGLMERALKDYDESLKYDPNNSWAYYRKGIVSRDLGDFVACLNNFHKAVARNRGSDLPEYLRTLGRAYWMIGFFEKGKYYMEEALTLDRDSANYIFMLSEFEYFYSEHFEEAFNIFMKAWEMDSTRLAPLIPMEFYYYMPSAYYKEAYLNAKKWIEYYKKTGQISIPYFYRIGMALWRVGKYDEARYFFKQEIKYGEEEIKLSRENSKNGGAQYGLAATYAFLGEKEKAYKYLDEFIKLYTNRLWWVTLARNDPFFDSIREEERFKNFINKIESRYQAEHERVMKWLEERGEL